MKCPHCNKEIDFVNSDIPVTFNLAADGKVGKNYSVSDFGPEYCLFACPVCGSDLTDDGLDFESVINFGTVGVI